MVDIDWNLGHKRKTDSVKQEEITLSLEKQLEPIGYQNVIVHAAMV